MKKQNKIIYSLIFIAVVLVIGFTIYLSPILSVFNAHAAKNMCSCIFVAGIEEEVVKKEELGFFPVNLTKTTINQEEKSVTASLWGMSPRKAYYREGLGCALFNQTKFSQKGFSLTLPMEDSLANYFEYQKKNKSAALSNTQKESLEKAMDWAFQDDESKKLFTRATLVIYKGELVAERYAKGFDKNSRLMGWSMTKGITAILYGILQKQGKLNIDDTTKLPEWKGTNKAQITFRHLLNMESGLEWQEDYTKISSVTKMLYQSDNLGLSAGAAGLEFTPATHWKYSSGTSNILAYALANYFPDKKTYHEFPYKELLYPIGAYSMVLETDASEHFVGSSYAWATGRDWAKLGLLMLNDGKWGGKQIIDKSFVDFIRKPLPNSEGHYGAGFWLNDTTNPEELMPDVPKDAYSYRGFHEQRIEIIPSKDLVIVRFGETHTQFDFNTWTKKVIEALDL